MWLGRIGGTLVILGSVLCTLAAALIVVGAEGGLRSMALLIVPAGIVPIGVGAAILAMAGPSPLDGRALRVGLAMLGIGIVSYLAANYLPVPAGRNNLQSWPHVILAVVGVLAAFIGVLVTVASLVRVPGPLRTTGLLLLAGILLLPIAAVLSNSVTEPPLATIGAALEVIGFAAVFVGLAGIGVLAIAGDRSA